MHEYSVNRHRYHLGVISVHGNRHLAGTDNGRY